MRETAFQKFIKREIRRYLENEEAGLMQTNQKLHRVISEELHSQFKGVGL